MYGMENGRLDWGQGCRHDSLTEKQMQVKRSWECRGRPCWLRQKRVHLQYRRQRFDPRVGKIPWRRKWESCPVFPPGELHGQRSLWAIVRRRGLTAWGYKGSRQVRFAKVTSS